MNSPDSFHRPHPHPPASGLDDDSTPLPSHFESVVRFKTLRVVFVAAREATVDLWEAELRKAGYLTDGPRVDSAASLIASLNPPPDLVLAEDKPYTSPGADALDTVRAHDSDLPFVLVLHADNVTTAVDALHRGADDVVSLGRSGQLVPAVLRAFAARGRRIAQRAASTAQARFAALVQSTSDAIMGRTLDGIITDWNPGAERLFGYTAAEAIGRPMALVIPPERVGEMADMYDKTRRGLAVPEFDTVRLHKSGRRLNVSASTSPICDAVGQVIGAVTTNRDIEPRKRAERTAIEQTRQFRALFDAALDAIVISDGTGQYIDANPAACDLFGVTRNELIGRRTEDFAAPGTDVGRLRRELLECGALSGEIRITRADGTVRVTEYQAVADFLPGRNMSVLRDVTDRRTTDEQLRQASKLEAVGRLAGGIAHDFNNLLTVINGFGHLVLGQLAADSPVRAMVAEMVSAGERATALTSQLLAFSRRQVIAPQVLNLAAVVADARTLLRRLLGEDVDLVISADPELGRVRADPGQVVQCLMNLAVNARDAMPTGGRLSIVIRNVDSTASDHSEVPVGRYVLVAVTDTGTGISPSVRERIFEPFFTTKPAGEGTGLGLAVVHGVVKQSGGHVVVDTAVGAGTTFRLYLPRVDSWSDTTPQKSGERVPAGTETILLVEDEEVVCNLSRTVLQTCGYTVLDAADGAAAVRIAAEYPGPIHLLATDVVMPNMGGRETATQVVATRPEVKVLYLSGYTDDAVVRHGVLAAEVAFLQKPFTPSALARKIREVLDRS